VGFAARESLVTNSLGIGLEFLRRNPSVPVGVPMPKVLQIRSAACHEFERALERVTNDARQHQTLDLVRNHRRDLNRDKRAFAESPEEDLRSIDARFLLQDPHGRDAVTHLVVERARVVDGPIDLPPARG
jgi:hypothetical protein